MNGEIRDTDVIKGKIYSDNNIVAKLDYVPTTVVNYEGDYTVTPSASDQTLETKNKLMVDNLVVESISYIQIPNEYGDTIYIGSDINGN